MTDKVLSLPEYPVTDDFWLSLSREERPVMVYGMGNGADKLFSRFEKYGIKPREVFASDGFVRGHSYRGMKVRSFSEIKAMYTDFVVVVSFASNRAEVIDLIKSIAKDYTVYIPDMPVAGDEYFDSLFYNENYESIKNAYEALVDERSKALFSSLIHYKLTAKPEYLFMNSSEQSEIYALVGTDVRRAVDAGAYNGDTVREMLSVYPNIEHIYAIEPDRRNCKKLTEYVESSGLSGRVTPMRFAVWSENSDGVFSGSGNRNSSVNSSVSYKSREELISLRSLDSQIDGTVDYIKYDVEGAEERALSGSAGLISANHPSLLVSAYHRSADIFSLVNKLSREYPFYDLYMRRTECFPAWEIALIAVAKRI